MLSTQRMSASRVLMYLLWFAPPVLQTAIAGKLWATKLLREFPWFFAYTVAHVVEFAMLFPTYRLSHSPFTAYFFEYWVGEAANVALGIAVIYELYSHVFRNYSAIRGLGRVLFQWSAAMLALVAVIMAAMSPGGDSDRVIAGILAAEQCFSIVRAGLLLFLFLFARAFGLTWRHYVFGIALGFAVYVSVELGTSAMRAHIGNLATSAYRVIKPAAYNCSAVIWVVYFLRAQSTEAGVRQLPRTDLEQWNEALLHILNR